MDSSWVIAAREVMHDYIRHRRGVITNSPNLATTAMRIRARAVEDVLGETLHGLTRTYIKLSGDHGLLLLNLHRALVHLWGDDRRGWDRVIAIYSFVGLIANELTCLSNGGINVDYLPRLVVDHLEEGAGSAWMQEQGGWQGFLTYTNSNSVEKSSSQALTILDPIMYSILFSGVDIFPRLYRWPRRDNNATPPPNSQNPV